VLRALAEPGHRVFTAGPEGEVVAVPRGTRRRRDERSTAGALVLWRPSGR